MDTYGGVSQEATEVRLNQTVFIGSAGVIVLMVLAAAIAPTSTGEMAAELQAWIVDHVGWYYVFTVAVILVSVAVFAFSAYGDIKLGPDHSEPDYGYLSWFAMLFSAGIGIGLMFFGVAEPVMHFLAPPQGDPGTVEAAREALILTFFHWGLHGWAIYAIVALVLAYFAYRHGLPLTLRSGLYPLIGERIYGPIGDVVDIFAIVGTTCGIATSLGFGVAQINTGLAQLLGIPVNTTVQMVLIVFTMALATVSVLAGLDRGIKFLSELNIGMAIALLLLVLLGGPTVYLLTTFVQNTGSYVAVLVSRTFNLYAYEPNTWFGGWTIFYWGWWLSWSPFVGLFIARISRGRTIREFVLGAMLVPTGFTLFWMTVFGNSAIDLILNQGMVSLGETIQADPAIGLFSLLEQFPFTGLLSTIAIFMVMVFFVTSADSGAMVLNMLCCHGRDDTPWRLRVFWIAAIGLTAGLLLLAGGLAALQTAAVASALPFSFAVLAAIWGFARALQVDHTKRQTILQGGVAMAPPSADPAWRSRLRGLLHFANLDDVDRFENETVLPALRDFAEELGRNGVHAEVIDDRTEGNGVCLAVSHGHEIDFHYEVRRRRLLRPGADPDGLEDGSAYYRAEVHLAEGGQDYDVLGWSRDQMAMDVLTQYEKHHHFLHLLR